MDYAALVSLTQTLNQILHTDQLRALIYDEPITLQIIQSLQEKASSLLSFLKDFPHKTMMEFERSIRDAACEAGLIIDSFLSSQLRLKYYTEKSYSDLEAVPRKIYHFMVDELSSSDDFKLLHEDLQLLILELHEVSQKIGKIVDEVKAINISPSIEDTHPKQLVGSSRHRPKGKDVVVVGLEDDVMAIRLRLCGESSKRELIPIVGMAGIGKTTLARKIYDDKLISETFHIRAFATISQEYNAQEVFKQLLSIKEPTQESAESLLQKLYQHLKGRRYLIILDDMWNGEAWDLVRRALPEDKNGSRIVLTTRISKVAEYVDSSALLHPIYLLDDDKSWNLLRKKIYGDESCPPELEEIGRNISIKCKGLPLSIVVIAGVLSSKRTVHHWNYVDENMMSELSNNGEDIFEIVSFSYVDLPNFLKPCYLYMGAAFPEDLLIDVDRLIQLWIAEGFIEPNACRNPEEIAEEYLEDLVTRNLVLVISLGELDDKIQYCRVHDVLREWCVRRAQEELFFVVDFRSKSKEAIADQRRVAIHNSCDGYLSSNDMINTSQVRTIMFMNEDEELEKTIRFCHLLRVLEAPFMQEIPELFQLRYLNLGTIISPSICRLLNLQTLILESGSGVLPVEIWEMHQLRHLVVSPHTTLPPPSKRSINDKRHLLQNLQTLYRVRDLTCNKEVVNMMPDLKKLGLYYVCGSSEIQESVYQLKNLKDTTHLQSLHLSLTWPLTFSMESNTVVTEEVYWNPDLLSETISAFPVTLTILHLEECRFPWESMTTVGSLLNLEVLKLEDEAFQGEKWETRDGEFCRLKVLIMKDMKLKRWIVAESTHFPALKRLHLDRCFRLREIPDTIGEIETLEVIELDCCGDTVETSARNIQKEQEDMGNELLQFRKVNSFRN